MKHLIPFLLIVCISCKKSDNGVAAERSALLVGKKWHLTDYYVDRIEANGTSVRTDLYFLIAGAAQDDFIIFKSDNTFETNDYALRDPNNPITVRQGIWHLLNNGTVMTRQIVYVNEKRRNVTMVSANVWTETEVDNGSTVTYTYTAIP
jgi:hypothetical protein